MLVIWIRGLFRATFSYSIFEVHNKTITLNFWSIVKWLRLGSIQIELGLKHPLPFERYPAQPLNWFPLILCSNTRTEQQRLLLLPLSVLCIAQYWWTTPSVVEVWKEGEPQRGAPRSPSENADFAQVVVDVLFDPKVEARFSPHRHKWRTEQPHRPPSFLILTGMSPGCYHNKLALWLRCWLVNSGSLIQQV